MMLRKVFLVVFCLVMNTTVGASPGVLNPGFEYPDISGYVYEPSGTDWSHSGGDRSVFIDAVSISQTGSLLIATNPSPPDGAEDVPPTTSLGWWAGTQATSHNIYLGTGSNDVNQANRLAGDINADGPTDWLDIFVMSGQWLNGTGNWVYDPVAHWKFDEGSGTTAVDSAGDNNADVYGPNWIAGKIGSYALDFNGVNDYAEAADNDSLDFGAGDSFTVSAWIKTSKNDVSIIDKRRVVGSVWYEGYSVWIFMDKVTFIIKDTGNKSVFRMGTTAVIDNKWHHIAAVRNTSEDKLYVYLDGVSDSVPTGDTTTATFENSESLLIGMKATGGYFDGIIDDISIYNRALKENDIAALAQGNYNTDLDYDGVVNMVDFAILANTWQQPPDPEYKGSQDNEANNIYEADLFEGDQTYYWRIDEVNGPNVWKGDIWNFKTADAIGTSSSGHYVTYKGDTLMLVGDSGTQCAAQNSNLDHREWIDDCNERGIRSIHVWAFVPARQKQDSSVIEDRWGYVYPDVMPWARKTSGPLALDQRYQWDLTQFDEGAVGDCNHYWPRMRDMASYAKSKNILLGISLFTGWTKHDYAWIYHPLKSSNGGHLTNNTDAVIIDTPGTELWQETYSGAWSNAKKTQWVWEQYSIKMINDLGSMGNVFFVFFDEHSYSEGNMGDHFRDFFRSRGQFWVDWNARRSTVDAVYGDVTGSDDKNADTVTEFNRSPARPFLMLEKGPYMGDGLRESICTMAVGGGHYFHHADEDQETVRTGIMGYDPYVPGGDKGMYKRNWLGYASRMFNEYVDDLDSMTPQNGLVGSGAYCLANNGTEYVVYSKDGYSSITVNLSAASGKTMDCRFYDPTDGIFESTFQRTGGSSSESFTKPSSNDWVLHIIEQ